MSPDKTFVGMSNYLRIFKDANVMNATKNTLVFTAVTMIGSNLLGLMFALMISRVSKLNNVLRTCIFVPYCLGSVPPAIWVVRRERWPSQPVYSALTLMSGFCLWI